MNTLSLRMPGHALLLTPTKAPNVPANTLFNVINGQCCNTAFVTVHFSTIPNTFHAFNQAKGKTTPRNMLRRNSMRKITKLRDHYVENAVVYETTCCEAAANALQLIRW